MVNIKQIIKLILNSLENKINNNIEKRIRTNGILLVETNIANAWMSTTGIIKFFGSCFLSEKIINPKKDNKKNF